MKYFFSIALIVILAGCSKNDCVQCSQQVKASSQPTPVYTDYKVVYVEFCGRQADTAMAMDVTTYPYFVTEHNLVAYTCSYNQ